MIGHRSVEVSRSSVSVFEDRDVSFCGMQCRTFRIESANLCWICQFFGGRTHGTCLLPCDTGRMYVTYDSGVRGQHALVWETVSPGMSYAGLSRFHRSQGCGNQTVRPCFKDAFNADVVR